VIACDRRDRVIGTASACMPTSERNACRRELRSRDLSNNKTVTIPLARSHHIETALCDGSEAQVILPKFSP